MGGFATRHPKPTDFYHNPCYKKAIDPTSELPARSCCTSGADDKIVRK